MSLSHPTANSLHFSYLTLGIFEWILHAEWYHLYLIPDVYDIGQVLKWTVNAPFHCANAILHPHSPHEQGA